MKINHYKTLLKLNNEDVVEIKNIGHYYSRIKKAKTADEIKEVLTEAYSRAHSEGAAHGEEPFDKILRAAVKREQKIRK